MDEVSVIYVDDPRNMTPQLCDWADKVSAMTLLLMRINDTNTDNCPSSQGCTISLAKSLGFNFEFRASIFRRVTEPHTQEEFHLLDCGEHTLRRG
jgi:hypothetical protein